jgi:hypothetical protein
VNRDSAHGMALRSPWYVGERGGYDRFDPQALVPALQKYGADDFVERLVADPRDSLVFDPVEDRWGYPVAVPHAERGHGRLRFATHRICRTALRKLYQPSHNRYYAVVVELYCDKAGLPRPGATDEVEVGFVLRRRRVEFGASSGRIRQLARDLITQLVAEQTGAVASTGMNDADLDEVLTSDHAANGFVLPPDVTVTTTTDAWLTGPEGRARWTQVGVDPRQLQSDPALRLSELEIPMWRLPPVDGSCERASTRSLWFGLVPTYSAERADSLDDPDRPQRTDKGALRLDDASIYEILCFSRKRIPGKENCPPLLTMSEPTEAFRFAPYFDPEGTKNRSVSITLPDFRSLAARAGQPAGTGGATMTSPPGSALTFANSGSIPASGSADNPRARVCTFAIELFTIVAFFVFSLFLPIVVFVFQLWWMLALRFCLPPELAALAALKAHFVTGGGSLATLPANLEDDLDHVIGFTGSKAKLLAASDFDAADTYDLVQAVDPTTVEHPTADAPESKPDDPLCDTGSPSARTVAKAIPWP